MVKVWFLWDWILIEFCISFFMIKHSKFTNNIGSISFTGSFCWNTDKICRKWGGGGCHPHPIPYIPLLDMPLELTSLWYKEIKNINPIQDGLFCGCSWMALPKICHTYPAMMTLGTVISYLKKIKKIYESRETPPPETTIFWYIKKYRYRLHFDTWFLTLLTCIDCIEL